MNSYCEILSLTIVPSLIQQYLVIELELAGMLINSVVQSNERSLVPSKIYCVRLVTAWGDLKGFYSFLYAPPERHTNTAEFNSSG